MAWQHILPVVFFWSDRPITFEKKVAKCSSMTKHNLSLTHSFKKNNVQWSTQVVQFTVQSHKCFSSRQSSYFNLQHFGSFVTQNSLWSAPVLRFNWNNFIASSRTFLNQTGLFRFDLFYCQCSMWRIQWWLIQLELLPWFVLSHHSFTLHWFCTIRVNVNIVEKTNVLMLICKLFWPHGHSAGDLGSPRASSTHYENCIPELTMWTFYPVCWKINNKTLWI